LAERARRDEFLAQMEQAAPNGPRRASLGICWRSITSAKAILAHANAQLKSQCLKVCAGAILEASSTHVF
jgi:hypothetical protein